VGCIVRLLGDSQRADAEHEAQRLLDDLCFQLEVDVRARSTEFGRERMSRFESEALEPALRESWHHLEKNVGHVPCAAQLPALRELGRLLAAWERCLANCGAAHAGGCPRIRAGADSC
jgi:hypothetical protein